MKKNYDTPEVELQEDPDVITTSGGGEANDPDVETQKLFFKFR